MRLSRIPRAATVLTTGLLLASCAGGEAAWKSSALDTPAPAGALYPSVAAAHGAVWISWLEEPETGPPAVRVARRDAGGWSEPRTVHAGPNVLVNWADFPSVALLADGTLAVHWLVSAPSGSLGYGARIAFSSDDGVTWSEPLPLHDDGDGGSEHGFVTLVPLGGDAVGSAWLDGRSIPSGGEMELRYRRWEAGQPGDEQLLDDDVCTCCNTAGVVADGRVLLAYRDHTAGEVRDIGVVDVELARPRAVHDDGWVIAACPVNGPGIAAGGGRVYTAWFTAADPEPRVLVALSADGGRTFGVPLRIDEGQPVGRVDIAAFDDGEAVVVWVERAGNAGEVRWRRVGADGKLHPSESVGPTRIDRSAGFPRVAAEGSSAYVTWRRPPHPWELGFVEIMR